MTAKTLKEEKAILNGLIKFNAAYGGARDLRELTISFKDANGKVVAKVLRKTGLRQIWRAAELSKRL